MPDIKAHCGGDERHGLAGSDARSRKRHAFIAPCTGGAAMAARLDFETFRRRRLTGSWVTEHARALTGSLTTDDGSSNYGHVHIAVVGDDWRLILRATCPFRQAEASRARSSRTQSSSV